MFFHCVDDQCVVLYLERVLSLVMVMVEITLSSGGDDSIEDFGDYFQVLRPGLQHFEKGLYHKRALVRFKCYRHEQRSGSVANIFNQQFMDLAYVGI